jgi:hypothetical protein
MDMDDSRQTLQIGCYVIYGVAISAVFEVRELHEPRGLGVPYMLTSTPGCTPVHFYIDLWAWTICSQ